jgi:hypothetical protein
LTDEDLGFLRATDMSDLLSKETTDTRRPLMTMDDLKLLETIESSYEKRIELGQSVEHSRTLVFLY